MDSVTQAALGAAVGHLCWHRQLGPKSLLAGAVLGTVPDLDIIIYPLLDEVQRLYWHRGESHSVFFMVLGAWATAWLLQRYVFKGRMSFTAACWGAFLIYSTHILIDAFTVYGTQLLAPFSRKGYALSNFFIIDPLFTLPLLAAVAYACFGKPSRQAPITATMLVLATCYTAWSLTIQSVADGKFRAASAKAGYEATRHITSAGPFTTFLWRHLAEVPGGYVLGYWSVFDTDDRGIEFHFIPKSAEKAAVLRGSRSFEVVEWFSQGWWCVIPIGDKAIRVVDLRFTEIPSSRHQGYDYWRWPFSWSYRLAVDTEAQPLRPVVPKVDSFMPTLGLLAHRIAGGDGWLNDGGKVKVSVHSGLDKVHQYPPRQRGGFEKQGEAL